MRKPNTTTSGGSFSASTIQAVWNKATIIPGYDPAQYRQDSCGAWIERSANGTTGEWGWEIDHIKPVAKNGTDDLWNLQPLHWRNNRHKGDDFPDWSCALRASA